MRLTSICLCAVVVLCLAQRTHVALTPQATPDKGSAPLLGELSLNDELEQQQPKFETVNLSSPAIAPDQGQTTYYQGVCSIDNKTRMLSGMCVALRTCQSKLDLLQCPKSMSVYPAGYICGRRFIGTRRVCYFHTP